MNKDKLKILRNSVDDAFFNCLQECIAFPIPTNIIKVLKYNYYNSAITISKIDENAIRDIEEVMRSDFKKEKVLLSEVPDYLLRYANDQQNFKFIGGQKILLLELANYCTKIFQQKTTSEADNTLQESATQDSSKQDSNSSDSTGQTVHQENREESIASQAGIHNMVKVLYKWMLKKPALTEILTENLKFKVVTSSLILHPGGTISCLMHCPVTNCEHLSKMTRKAYPRYYKSMKQQAKPIPSIWNFSGIRTHLLKKHSNNVNNRVRT